MHLFYGAIQQKVWSLHHLHALCDQELYNCLSLLLKLKPFCCNDKTKIETTN